MVLAAGMESTLATVGLCLYVTNLLLRETNQLF